MTMMMMTATTQHVLLLLLHWKVWHSMEEEDAVCWLLLRSQPVLYIHYYIHDTNTKRHS